MWEKSWRKIIFKSFFLNKCDCLWNTISIGTILLREKICFNDSWHFIYFWKRKLRTSRSFAVKITTRSILNNFGLYKLSNYTPHRPCKSHFTHLYAFIKRECGWILSFSMQFLLLLFSSKPQRDSLFWTISVFVLWSKISKNLNLHQPFHLRLKIEMFVRLIYLDYFFYQKMLRISMIKLIHPEIMQQQSTFLFKLIKSFLSNRNISILSIWCIDFSNK